MAVTINNESTITKPPPLNCQHPKSLVGLALRHYTGTKYLPNILLLLKHTKCYSHMGASMGLDKSIQPAQLLELSRGPKFCAFQAGFDFQNF